ncbi:MAG: carbon-monoxide dehydrogenase large subunit [Chloroflexota bacterium]|nr:molybdopterin-dependent oxidoreductase [Caldilinea sp.]GIK73969.1 MAG: carbon-monoxide dehydrogenase large subunit [Chloroflexota bacterium]
MRAVGSSLPRIDAAEKVTGAGVYAGDIDLPGQAWLKVVFAGTPHARIRAMDVSAARAMPGVVAVLTAADVPVNEYGLIMPDQPVLCGLGSTPQAEIVRWEADHVALVVAESEAQAEAAAKAIVIDYEPLPVITDPFAAMAPDAPPLHPYSFRYPYGERDPHSNVLLEYTLTDGDVEAGFAQADVVVESVYHTHAQEHAYLQPEAGVAWVRPDGCIEVICPGQWMHEEREQIAHALGLPQEQIVVRHGAVGGAFGGREDISIQIVLALAAWKTGRPVKTVWSREESIVGHHKRHPYTIKAKWGGTRDGKIVAAQMDLTSDCGAYAYTSTKVLGNALLAALGPYKIPNVHVVARTVYTNNTPSGAFRGFGGPQGHFAAEMQVNKLAEALGIDPVELRMRNLWREGVILPTKSPLPAGCTIREVVAAAAERGGWRHDSGQGWRRATDGEDDRPSPLAPRPSLQATQRRIARGVGFACCFKNVGFSLGFPEHCSAWVEVHGDSEIERAVIGCVGADVGQGAHSAFRQIAAEVLGLAPEQVEVRTESTEVTGSSGSASASRMTFMAGNAIKGAAERALQEWQNEERPARAEFVFRPRPTTAYDRQNGAADPNVTYGYCAQVAEVEVDLDTGHVHVMRMISANDVGRAVNPQQVEGQIEGGVVQAMGWALMEKYVQRNGRAVTQHLSTYLIPGVLDAPTVIEPVILEFPDPQGPLGIRGMAEMPFIPVAPAIGAAIHDAIGCWIDELPYTPEQVWRALQR